MELFLFPLGEKKKPAAENSAAGVELEKGIDLINIKSFAVACNFGVDSLERLFVIDELGDDFREFGVNRIKFLLLDIPSCLIIFVDPFDLDDTRDKTAGDTEQEDNKSTDTANDGP